jgi:NhaP-type Na+/H+ or K+/H+ antiporter
MVELASIIILGIFAQWLAWRFKVPAILPLLLIGLAVGPFAPYWMSEQFLAEGQEKWLNPLHNGTTGLFPGDNLFFFVELAIGIILFEGGLTLKRNEIASIGSIVGKLISVGSFVTFALSTLAAHFIIDLSWSLSFLFAALIIVTGPTVIAPILRNIPLKKDVANILKWEGILIDPIGALAAVLVYEFLASTVTGHGGHGGHSGGSFSVDALKHFITLTLEGFSLGTLAAFALKKIIQKHWVPHYLMNVFTLAFVLFVFVSSGLLVADSGLLTVVVMGTVIANIDMPRLDEILYFKESLAVLLVSMLFILLSANISMEDLRLIMNLKAGLLFLAVILIVRPLGVFLSSIKSSLNLNEKLFISWVGPRGIVAAGIASLFGTKLMNLNTEALSEGLAAPFPGAELITPLVFMIVLGTVLLNATTAGFIAGLLGVKITKAMVHL